MESTHTKRLVIGNFKSIKHLDIDCKKVNVFIGKPNVGKSNILEGISLLGATYSRNRERFLSDFIRYENFYNLFYDNELENNIYVETDLGGGYLFYIRGNANRYQYIFSSNYEYESDKKHENLYFEVSRIFRNIKGINYEIDDWFTTKFNTLKTGGFLGVFQIFRSGECSANMMSSVSTFASPLKKYDFVRDIKIENLFSEFLLPPKGENLFTTLKRFKGLNKEAVSIFQEYGLNLVFRERNKIFEIQKNIEGIITEYPYSSMADTLQRIIFYLLAIETNKNSVLIFEEPEAHSFPPYTKMLAERIAENESNQFFITTHSPYLLQTLIENVGSENLNIFVTYYEDYQTKVRKISEEEFRDIDAMDIFFNLDKVNA